MVVSSVTPLMPAAMLVHLSGRLGERALQQLEDDARTPRSPSSVGLGHRAGLLELDALVDEQGGVAAVVEDHVGAVRRRAR